MLIGCLQDWTRRLLGFIFLRNKLYTSTSGSVTQTKDALSLNMHVAMIAPFLLQQSIPHLHNPIATIIVLLCRQVVLQTRDLSIPRDVVINPPYPCICMYVLCMYASTGNESRSKRKVEYGRNGYMWRVENLWNRWKWWSVCTLHDGVQ